MPFLDPNWKPRPEDEAMGRGLGRTTKMLSQVIVLAAEPQHIVTLWPNRDVARWAVNYTAQLVDAELGSRLKPNPDARGNAWYSTMLWWTRLDFVPISVEPGGWIKNVKSLSILVDHSVDDMVFERRASISMLSNLDQWRRAINLAVALGESGQTIHDLRMALLLKPIPQPH